MNASIKAACAVLLVSFSLITTHANAYDPYLKGSTISGGSHYSDQTAFSATSAVANQLQDESGDWKATIALPYNFTIHYDLADFSTSNIKDDIKLLTEEADDKNLSLTKVQDLRGKAESILQQIASKGSVISGGAMTNGMVPVIAITHPSLQGTLTFEHQESFQNHPSAFSASFTSGYLTIDPKDCQDVASTTDINKLSEKDITSCFNALTPEQQKQFCPNGVSQAQSCDLSQLSKVFSLDSNATINLRAALEYNNNLIGYSRPVLKRLIKDNHWASGVLFAGGKISYTSVETASKKRKLTDLQNKENDTSNLAKEITDSTKRVKNSGIGLDLGLSWLSSRYFASVIVNNIVAPEIKYSDGYTIKQDTATSLAASLYLNESQSWALRLQNDFAAIKNLTGTEYQWRVASLGYTSKNWYIPGIEIAKRWNIANEKQSYTALGFKLFDVFQMSVAINDKRLSNVPLGGIFSFGFGFSL